MTPAERALALALARSVADRLRSEVTLLEVVLELLDPQAGEAQGFAAAERSARLAGRLGAVSEQLQQAAPGRREVKDADDES